MRIHQFSPTVNIMVCVAIIGTFSMPGCGRKVTPVSAISVESSGVTLRDVEPVAELATAWPGWRGPNYNGHAPDQELPISWSSSEGVLWMRDVPGRGHASPTVFGDLVLMATAVDAKEQQWVIAYDAETGDQRWESLIHEGGFPKPGEVHRKASNANNTVACDGQRVYVAFFSSGTVTATALDLNGQQVWQRDLGEFDSKFGFAPSPILYKSFVIFAADNRGGGSISALDSATGEIAWRIARDAKNSHSSPMLATVGGKEQLLISGCDQVTSYDPATGKLNWSTPATSETTCGTMVVAGDYVYASGGYPNSQTVCLTSTGEKVWENKVKIYEPSMVADGDSIFAVSDDGIAYCWNAKDGTENWKKRLGGNFSASPIVCNGNIYVSDLSGKTYVFKASADGYEELAENKLGADCYGSPAIVNSKLYLRIGFGAGDTRQEKLVCIGQK